VIISPDCPTRSQSLCRLRYPAHIRQDKTCGKPVCSPLPVSCLCSWSPRRSVLLVTRNDPSMIWNFPFTLWRTKWSQPLLGEFRITKLKLPYFFTFCKISLWVMWNVQRLVRYNSLFWNIIFVHQTGFQARGKMFRISGSEYSVMSYNGASCLYLIIACGLWRACQVVFRLQNAKCKSLFNLQEPCALDIGRAYRYPPNVAFYIFFEQI